MNVIGISGYARCGKDTFVGIAKEILTKNGYTPIRVAFADSLKNEVEHMLNANKFQATVYTDKTEEKTLIRPLLVWWGCQRRYESEGGLHWVNVVENEIRNYANVTSNLDINKMVFLVSDVRFANEAKWIHEKFDGVVIHLKRYSLSNICDGGVNEVPERILKSTKVYDAAPNSEEAKNDPLVQDMADLRTEWESKKKMTNVEAIQDLYLQQVVLDTLNQTKYFNGSLSQ